MSKKYIISYMLYKMKNNRNIFIFTIIIVVSFLLINNTFAISSFSETDPVGEKIHYNSGGFEKLIKAGGYPYKNKISIGIDENDNNNHYLLFESIVSSSYSHWDLSIKNPTRYMVFDFYIRTSSNMPNGYLTYKNVAGNTEGSIISFYKNQITFKNETIYNIESNSWYNIVLVCDFLKYKVTAYINGELVQNEESISFGKAQKQLSSIRFYFNSSSETDIGNNIMIDNLKIYEGTIPRNISNDESEATPAFDISNDDDNTIYVRPTQSQIKNLITEQNNVHPRVMMTPEIYNNIVIKYRTNDNIKKWGNQIISVADSYLDSFENDTKNLLAYTIKGGQLLDTSRAIYERSKYLSMAYILTNNSKYADCLYNIFQIAGATDGSFPDWNISHFLDVSEMSAAFAIGYDWLYDYWSDSQKQFLEETIYNRSLLITRGEYYFEGASDHWIRREASNWNIVCNSGNLMGAVAIFDKYPDLSAEIIYLALRSSEIGFKGFYPDGGWEEGISYWAYTLSYAANMLSTLDTSFGTDFNLSQAPGFANTYKFRLASQGAKYINNFHDGSNNSLSIGSSDTYFWLSNKFNVPDLTKLRLYYLNNEIYSVNPFDIIWYNTNIKDTNYYFPSDYYFKEIEYVTLSGKNALVGDNAWLSFHGGKAMTNHSHLDTGTFVFEVGGIMWAIEVGKEKYGNYSNDIEKLNFYKTRPEGHNLYVINPSDDITNYGQTLDHFAEVEKIEKGINEKFAILDLSQAYRENASNAKRGYMLSDHFKSGIVRDEITFNEKGSEIYWFMHIIDNAQIEIINSHTAHITYDGITLKFMIYSDLSDYEFGVMESDPLYPDTVQTGLMTDEQSKIIRKLFVYGKSSNDDNRHYIQCKMILLSDEHSSDEMQLKKLEDWKIEEPIIYGDINADGTVDINDARITSKYIIDGNSSINDMFILDAADINSDDRIKINDVVEILRVINN